MKGKISHASSGIRGDRKGEQGRVKGAPTMGQGEGGGGGSGNHHSNKYTQAELIKRDIRLRILVKAAGTQSRLQMYTMTRRQHDVMLMPFGDVTFIVGGQAVRGMRYLHGFAAVALHACF